MGEDLLREHLVTDRFNSPRAVEGIHAKAFRVANDGPCEIRGACVHSGQDRVRQIGGYAVDENAALVFAGNNKFALVGP